MQDPGDYWTASARNHISPLPCWNRTLRGAASAWKISTRYLAFRLYSQLWKRKEDCYHPLHCWSCIRLFMSFYHKDKLPLKCWVVHEVEKMVETLVLCITYECRLIISTLKGLIFEKDISKPHHIYSLAHCGSRHISSLSILLFFFLYFF